MSTILRALKKLEQEKASMRPSGPTPVFSDASATEESVGRWLFNPWVRWSAVGTIMLMLSLTAFYFYRQSREPLSATAFNRDFKTADRSIHRNERQRQPAASSHRSNSTARERQKVPEVQRPPAASRRNELEHQPSDQDFPLTAMNRPSESKSVTQPLTIDNQAKNTEQRIQRPKLPQTRPSADVPKQVNVSGRPVSEKTSQTNQMSAAVQKPVAKVQPQKETSKERKSDGYDKAPALQDGRLKIQAIAWSPNPDDRMAVINARVIHEGESMESFQVVAIRQDDVVVKEKQSGTWRVLFGRP